MGVSSKPAALDTILDSCPLVTLVVRPEGAIGVAVDDAQAGEAVDKVVEGELGGTSVNCRVQAVGVTVGVSGVSVGTTSVLVGDALLVPCGTGVLVGLAGTGVFVCVGGTGVSVGVLTGQSCFV